MATGRLGLIVAAGTVGLLAGCVDRRFVVRTNVPGATISVDGTPLGPSPVDSRWEYAGFYQFTAAAPGYQPLTQRVRLKPRWYQYPPIDLIAEVLWPFRIEDVRHVYLELEPVRPINQLELIANADALRARGLTLPPSTVTDEGERPRGTEPVRPAPLVRGDPLPALGPGPLPGTPPGLMGPGQAPGR